MAWLNDVEVFVRVVQTGNFTAAAEQLNLSKSVVSKYVTRLEHELGARLLNRTTRRLSLTEAGEVFFERCRFGLQEIDGARSEVSWMQGEPRGKLKLSAPVSFGVAHLAPILSKFVERHPAVDIDMVMDDRKVDLIKEGFDLALRLTKELAESSLIAKRIAPCRHVVCASPAYLEKHGIPQKPQDIADHTILKYRYQHSALEWDFKAPDGTVESVEVKSRIQINNSLAIRELLLAGVGLTRVPTYLVGHDIAAGRLKAVLSDYQALEISIFVIYPHREFLSPKVRAFVSFLSEQITERPTWDEFSHA